MSPKQLLKQLTLLAFLAGTGGAIANSALAQSFYYYPSASFFSPTAYYYQSDNDPALGEILQFGEQFATFNSNIQQTELAEILDQEELLTVLAPTEKAFAALSLEMRQKLSEPETLEKVLQYHIIEGEITEEDIKRRQVETLLENNSVKITGVPAENNRINVQLNKAIAGEPLQAYNGVVIPIDRVLIPSSLNLK